MASISPIQTLLEYPQAAFGEVASPRWKTLCEGLETHKETGRQLEISAERRWELLSALQKSIRRGWTFWALHTVAASAAIPTLLPHLARRLAVIACEDIGIGDETLTRFTVACSAVFTPKRSAVELPSVLCFLVSHMCSVHQRSRIACSLSLIAESAAMGVKMSNLNAADRAVFSAIQERTARLEFPETAWRRWQRTNDWRGERMLRYLDLPLPFDLVSRSIPLRPAKILHDLPSYSYDLHTRIGRAVIQALIRGEKGAQRIKVFFLQHNVSDRSTALGMALFYSEGGQLRNELFFEEVLDLEQRMIAQRFGLRLSEWNELRAHTHDALDAGVIDRLRQEELQRRALQIQLPFEGTV